MERGGGTTDITGENEWKHAWAQCRINRTLGNHYRDGRINCGSKWDCGGEGKGAGKKNNYICTCTLDMNEKNHYQQALRHNFW